MSSGPEGGLSKRKQNRLTLKAAIAALSMASSAPVPAEPSLGTGPEARIVVKDFADAHTEDNELLLRTLRVLDSARLKDSEYMRALESAVREIEQGRGREIGESFDEYAARGMADEAIFYRRTGKRPEKMYEFSLDQFSRLLAEAPEGGVLREMLKERAGSVYTLSLWNMNDLHDSSPARRLSELRGATPEALFDMIALVGEDAYLSTFNLLYNGNGFSGAEARFSFKERAREAYGSVRGFFEKERIDKDDFGTFLELISQNNLLDTFLADLGTAEEQQEVLGRLLFIPKEALSVSRAVMFNELLHATKNELLRESMYRYLRDLMHAKEENREIVGILIAEVFRDAPRIPAWAQGSVDAYKDTFSDTRKLEHAAVFRAEGGREINVQLHTFYDDRKHGAPESAWDGHQSFRNFIRSLGGSVTWKKNGAIEKVIAGKGVRIEDRGEYILAEKTDPHTGRTVVMYANKPDRDDEVIARVNATIMREYAPHIVVHRGHSFHAGKTIALLNESVAMVHLGSCGGAKETLAVLKRTPNIQVMTTRGVGTMLVNDVVIRAFNDALLKSGEVDWEELRKRMDASFKGGDPTVYERFQSYRFPHRNTTAHLTAALTRIKTAQ